MTQIILLCQRLKSHNHVISRGFTLIELLVVIAIIGILASVVLVAFPSSRMSAHDAIREQDIHQIMTALELYYLSNGHYPTSRGATYPNSGWTNSADSSWTAFKNALVGDNALPVDPLNQTGGWARGGKYNYSYYSLGYGCQGQWYMIVYTLENKTDPDLAASPGVTTCNGMMFNYAGTITIGKCHGCE